MEQLKATLLQETKSLDEVRRYFKNILIRLTIINAGLALIILIGLATIIYLIYQPSPANMRIFKNIDNIQKNLAVDRKLMIMDREDISKARTQVVELQRKLFAEDSIRHKLKR